MSRLIDVDKIDWQKGVFVNPNTDEPECDYNSYCLGGYIE
jgi:hypothetical protein